MLKKVLAIVSVIISVIGIIVLWLYLPEEKSAWFKWTVMGLMTSIIMFIVYWWWKQRRISQVKSEEHDLQILLKQDTRVIQQLFQVATKKIRGQGRSKLESLYSLPWYLVIGGENDSKSEILLQNGFEVISKSETESYLCFWSNDNAIVIEVGQRIFTSEGVDEALWKVLAKQLFKYRPRQGLNGIIAVVGCDRLITSDKKERTKLSTIYQKAVLSMGGVLDLNLPVYTVISKADTIADFIGFFEGFSAYDSEKPFGITFDCDYLQRYDKNQFTAESHTLITSVAGQQFELLRNVSREKSSSIVAWPYQLRIFLQRVNELLSDIGRENRTREAVWIRGVYLMSAVQKGTKYDLLTQVVAERAEFNLISQCDQKPSRRGFFTKNLFNKIILPEKSIVGVNEWCHSAYLMLRSAALGMIVALVFIAGLKLKYNWNLDEEWRLKALTQIHLYKSGINQLRDDCSISEMISVLSELENVALKGVQRRPWHQMVSMKQIDTAESVYSAYVGQLHQILLPKLEELIVGELYVYINLGNSGRIFEVLRYYQMLFDKKQLNLKELQAYLLDNLKEQGELSSDELFALSSLIEHTFRGDYDKQLQPNKDLMSVAINNLEGFSPERLIYTRIKTMPEYRMQVDLRSQLGENFDSLFEFSSDFHGYLIPEIFTKQGYTQIDLSPKSELLNYLIGEFKAIQGDFSGASIMELTELSKQVQRLYFADYVYYWKELINNIQVKQFDNVSELSLALREASVPVTSPLLGLLDAVAVNTTLAVNEVPEIMGQERITSQFGLEKINELSPGAGDKLLRLQPSFVVNETFLSFSRFVSGNGEDKVEPVYALIAQFDALNLFFDTALSSTDPSKLFHTYAVAHAKGSTDPIVTFRKAGMKAPSKVSSWIRDLSAQAWQQVVSCSLPYLNTQWDERVYQSYMSSIEGRFPFAQHGRGEVALDDFMRFFKPRGRIDLYMDEFLTSFVYWDNGRLKLLEVDGITLPISKNMRGQLERVRKLREIFFGASGEELALKIGFKASSMSTNVTEFQLKETESLFSYKHGPRVWRDVTWPISGVDGYISTEFYSGKNLVASKSFTGQWALFRAIFSSRSSATSSRLTGKLNYRINHNNIALDYTLRDSNHPLDKSLFVQFSLPRQLQG
ncbi:type VI secretion system membrane subunit TssM [Vibrio pectenicida]|uniref:Type VI secretion system membrane subunit TssM n=1 Tax=Vibrio pectenicida TaxID=62763 RepID=A0A7Y3ZWQ4_9VIBR|nr:type VI secretion system membrane subunit TssM [Vibrio pectenicida]NOH70347.1 type VI secretion system membrane subunit TssM [Vibrio pectenicida]